MSRYQLIWALALFLAFPAIDLIAQDTRDLSELYESQRIDELKQLNDSNSISQPDWREFVKALFVSDAETATQSMLATYATSRDDRLKRHIRQRVAQFYAARGYYETARRIEEEDSFMERLVTLNQSRNPQRNSSAASDTNRETTTEESSGSGKWFIQVGAYSTLQNARRATQKYRRYYPTTRILEKEKDGQQLFLVVVGDYRSRSQAETALPEVNNRLNLQGYIIEY